MNCHEKQIKIHLQISRKRKRRNDQNQHRTTPNTEHLKTSHSKIHLTLKDRQSKTKDTIKKAPENSSKILISQFYLPENTTRHPTLPTVRDQTSKRAQTLQDQIVPPTVRLPQRSFPNQTQQETEEQRRKMLKEIAKKDAQIKFYEQLMQERNSHDQKIRGHSVQSYEQYLRNLIKVTQEQLQRQKNMQSLLEEFYSNQAYQRKRAIINREGQMGLNYSRKQLSTFSGMSLFLLSKRNSFSSNKQRDELFSFGSTIKSKSTIKHSTDRNYFLNPMKSRVSGRKINFDG